MDEIVEFDAAELLDYLGGDPAFAAEMIDLFFEDTAKSAAGIKAAAAAQNNDEIAEHAHALKGNAANIRAKRFREFVQLLEDAAKQRGAELPELLQRLDAEYARISEVLRGWQKGARGA